MSFFFFFFFSSRRRHTRSKRDWSSDVCSSDLGRSQLLVYHFMFGPDYTAGCATCSTIADGFDGFAVHLANRSEERRVGKECRSRWSAYHEKKKEREE